jgi:hypothetical protein
VEETKLLALDLSVASSEVIELLILDPPDQDILHDILLSNRQRPEILRLLLNFPNVPEEIRKETGKALGLTVKFSERPAQKEQSAQAKKQGILQKIQRLSVGERIALALKGGREIRSALSKDPNKEVVTTVLKNPKITETEVEIFAHSRNIPEDVLRQISKNREWMQNYQITLAMVNNPKTPPGIGSSLVAKLLTKDIAVLEKNKNVSQALRALAKKVLQARIQR